jgi:peptidyl-prolyl cis-trans isomerase A (cyclophilin A)
MTKTITFALAALLAAPAFAQTSKPDLTPNPAAAKAAAPAPAAPAEQYALFDTTAGKIGVKLYAKRTPKTVENFVGLATGTREYTDPNTLKKSKKPFYDGTVFHRVIPNFMIQGGDPTGTGRGDPGYKFADEVFPDDNFRPGLLAMANAGPGTNGSQFFITESAPTYLNGKHTIFGEVVCGQELVPVIAKRGNGATRINKVVITAAPPTCQ